VEGDDAAEGAARITVKREAVCLPDRVPDRDAARVRVFDDDAGGFVKLMDESPGGIRVEHVEIAQAAALVLRYAVPPAALPFFAVQGCLLVRVFAVTQLRGAFQSEMQAVRVRSPVLIEPADDGAVVRGSVGESFARERAAQLTELSVGKAGKHCSVVGRIDDDENPLMRFRGSADEGGPADVDVF